MTSESSYAFLKGRNIRVLISCRIIWGLAQALFTPYFSLFALAQQGMTVELLGLAISMKAVGTAIVAPLAGYLADSVGRKKMIFAGTSLHAVSYLFYFAATDFKMIFIGSMIEGISIVHFPALMALTQDSLTKGRRGLGLSATISLQALPSLISPLIGGIFAGQLGVDFAVRIGLASSAVVGLAVAFIRLNFLEETLEPKKHETEHENLSSIIKKSYKDVFAVLREYNALKGLVALCVVDTLFSAIAAPFWVVYGEMIVGLTTAEWGLSEVTATGVYMLVMFFSGRLADRYGSKKVMLTNLLIAPAINLSFIFCQDFHQILAFRIMLAVQNAFIMPAATALIADIVPRKQRGRAIAAIGWQPVIISLGAVSNGFLRFPSYFAGSLLSGYIYSIDVRYPWFLLAMAYAIESAICYFLIRQPEKPAD